MTKFLKYILVSIFAIAFSSCDKEEIGGTATEDLAGEWMVTVNLAVANGNIIAEDPYGLGYFQIITYNTASNVSSEMWINDLKGFWDFIVKIPCDANSQTFGSSTPVQNTAYDCQVTITNGKVVYGGTVSPVGGRPADSIEFLISFSDDDPGTTYLIKGYRRTGLSGGAE